jgi:diguanylate cyclase (GGDEF)-like protein/PAS domain S-box-containing protein
MTHTQSDPHADPAPILTGELIDASLLQRLREEKAILANATVGIMFTRDRVYQRINRRAAEMFGWPDDTLTGQPTPVLFPDTATYGELARAAGPCLSQDQTFIYECAMQRKDGEQIWVKLSARGIEDGHPEMGTIWIAEDITEQRAAQNELQRAMKEIYGILNTAVMGVALLRHRNIDRCNRRMEELFGFTEGTMAGCSTRVWYADNETWAFVGQDVYGDLQAGREAFRELWFQRQDGTRFWGRLAGRAFDPADPYAGSVWIIEDLTREKAEREELLLARKVFEVNSEAIMVTDTSNKIVQVNSAFERITGYHESEVLGRDPKLLGSGRHDSAFFHGMWQALVERGHWSGEIWDKRKDGSEYPKWVRIDTIRDAEQHITHYVTVFSDISERKASEERIRYLAQHDALTGLPNRFTLAVHLEHALARAERSDGKVGLMFIDLDNFKMVNDTLGHHVGDLLLCEVARRISSTVRKSDIVARIGGDEFVVVLENTRLPGDAAQVAQKIIEQMNEAIPIEAHELHTTPSIGIGIYPEDGKTCEILMKNADVAMYHAKSAGRNNFQFYAEHMNQAAAIRVQMEGRLRAALQGDEFILHYQPQIDLISGKVSGVEALIRWESTELGRVPPASFIPLAEEIGLIVPISEWVLRTACKTAKAWQEAGIDFGCMSVNISPQQFRQRNFPQRLVQILNETGLTAKCLELEITESSIMETAEVTIAMLLRLKELGIALAVDDFGTGYSSLAYLKRFPIDRLKIDRSFVTDLETDSSDAAIASAIIALAHSLGLSVVAEGVETQGQSDFLRRQGCDSVQGYFYSRPVDAAAASEICRTGLTV